MFSGFLVVASLLVIVIRGFHLGTDFAGGTTLTFTPNAAGPSVSNSSVTQVLDSSVGSGNVEAVQTLGGKTIQATLKALTESQVATGKTALVKAFNPVGGVSASNVSSSWGAQISQRAVLAVLIFLVLVGAFIWIRYEKRVAAGAVLSHHPRRHRDRRDLLAGWFRGHPGHRHRAAHHSRFLALRHGRGVRQGAGKLPRV